LKSLLKVCLLVGVMAVSLAATEKEAQADTVLTSWYGPGFEGALTASGEPFNPWDYTAAHPYLPFGTLLEVCYSGCVTVRVNDRGPYVHGRGLDLSQGAAQAIGLYGVGWTSVRVVSNPY
jgi:rare lipoprotein A